MGGERGGGPSLCTLPGSEGPGLLLPFLHRQVDYAQTQGSFNRKSPSLLSCRAPCGKQPLMCFVGSTSTQLLPVTGNSLPSKAFFMLALFENSSRMFFISLILLVLPRRTLLSLPRLANSCLTQFFLSSHFLHLLSFHFISFCSLQALFLQGALEVAVALGPPLVAPHSFLVM